MGCASCRLQTNYAGVYCQLVVFLNITAQVQRASSPPHERSQITCNGQKARGQLVNRQLVSLHSSTRSRNFCHNQLGKEGKALPMLNPPILGAADNSNPYRGCGVCDDNRMPSTASCCKHLNWQVSREAHHGARCLQISTPY